jgi:hypothetical protein
MSLAGTTTGTLTSTAMVVSNTTSTVPTSITFNNGVVIVKDLPKGVVINTVNEKKNTVIIIY